MRTVHAVGTTRPRMMAIAIPPRSDTMPATRVPTGPLTWQGTSGNGWPIGMMKTIISTVRHGILQGPPQANRPCCAAGGGQYRPQRARVLPLPPRARAPVRLPPFPVAEDVVTQGDGLVGSLVPIAETPRT